MKQGLRKFWSACNVCFHPTGLSIVLSDCSVTTARGKKRLLHRLELVVAGEMVGSNWSWNLPAVLQRCCQLMNDFHTFPYAMKLKKRRAYIYRCGTSVNVLCHLEESYFF